jgi:D-3-phosphoglycerate dehydrogenase
MEVVARIGVGYDAVDVPALTARRIPLMIAGTANSVSVAEHALFFIFALAKRSVAHDAMVREARWGDRFMQLPIDLAEKTVLVVGFGRIGTRAVKRLVALDMRVLVYDPYVDAAAIKAADAIPVTDLDASLGDADFVTIHCPKNRETTNMFDAARLGRMKPSAYIVNTARGGIINEPALCAALAEGRLAGAGIDVFEREPAGADHPFCSSPNVIMAPHMAGVSSESVARMATSTINNILSVLDGKPNRENAVNPEVLER